MDKVFLGHLRYLSNCLHPMILNCSLTGVGFWPLQRLTSATTSRHLALHILKHFEHLMVLQAPGMRHDVELRLRWLEEVFVADEEARGGGREL